MKMKTLFTGAGIGILLASLALTGPLAAQEQKLQLFVHGGGYSMTQDVDPGGLADFDTGFNVGAGVGVVLSKYIAVRADFTYGRAEANDRRPDGAGLIGGALNGEDFNHYLYGGDIQLRLPVGDRLVPYIFAGGGGITLDPAFTAEGAESFTNGAGKFGAGVEWNFAGTGFGLIAQGTTWVYDLDNTTFGFDETQYDVTYSLGVSYAFGL